MKYDYVEKKYKFDNNIVMFDIIDLDGVIICAKTYLDTKLRLKIFMKTYDLNFYFL